MLRSSRAQAAMEFLMTYGWAILIVLTVLAVLFYLGVFSTNSSVPSSCVFPAGFTCSEFRLDENGNLYLDLGQATGKMITVTGIGCGASDSPIITDYVSVPIPSGSHARVSGVGVPCLNSSGTSFKGKVVIRYTTVGSGITREMTATLSAPMSGTGTGTGYASDLVLLLHLDNNAAIGETAATAVDSSGNGNNCSISNAVWNASGKVGGAMAFNGVNSVLNCGNSSLFSFGNQSFTISLWLRKDVRINLTNDYYEGVVNKREISAFAKSPGGIFVSNNPNHNGMYVLFGMGDGNTNIHSISTVLDGNWTHVVAVGNSTHMRLYKNAALVGTDTVFNIAQTTDSLKAGYFAAADRYFNGTLDELRIYNRTLSPDEITALYLAGG